MNVKSHQALSELFSFSREMKTVTTTYCGGLVGGLFPVLIRFLCCVQMQPVWARVLPKHVVQVPPEDAQQDEAAALAM